MKRVGPKAILFFTVFMDLVGFGIVLPLLPIYAEEYGASALTAGLLLASFSLMQFLFAPAWGHLSDRIGRRPVLLISLLGSVIGYSLFAWASAIQSLTLLFVARILSGVMGANIPVAQAYIADTTTADDRAHGMGLIGAAFGLGFILGPALAGLAIHVGEAGPGIVAAVICAINLLLAFRRLPESLSPENRTRHAETDGQFRRVAQALVRPGLRGLLWMFFIFTIALSVWETTLPAFCMRRFNWDEHIMPWIFVYAGVLSAFFQGYLIRRLRKRATERSLIRVGSILTVLGYIGIALGGRIWIHLVSLAVLSLGIGATSPSLMGLLSRRASADEQGRTLGVGQSLSSAARVLGPVAGYGLLGYAEFIAGEGEAMWPEAMPFLLAATLGTAVVLGAVGLRRSNATA